MLCAMCYALYPPLDVLVRLRLLARLEAELLFREYKNYPGVFHTLLLLLSLILLLLLLIGFNLHVCPTLLPHSSQRSHSASHPILPH